MQIDHAENHFRLFALPVDFVLDTQQLVVRYRELQKKTHPDQYANASDQEKRIALQQSMRVNEAYETLSDPLKRAIYLLSLHGLDVAQDNTTQQDSEFLMQQMHLREHLADIKQQPNPSRALETLMMEIEQLLKAQIDALKILFASNSAAALVDAQTSVSKMQFLHKLQLEAETIAMELEETS